jgi:hypothetical protein
MKPRLPATRTGSQTQEASADKESFRVQSTVDQNAPGIKHDEARQVSLPIIFLEEPDDHFTNASTPARIFYDQNDTIGADQVVRLSAPDNTSDGCTTAQFSAPRENESVEIELGGYAQSSILPSDFSAIVTTVSGAAESIRASVLSPILELWNEAYEDLRAKQTVLITQYEQELAKTSTVSISDLSKDERCGQMTAVLKQKLEEVEDKRWKRNFMGHDLKVKDLVEPVVGVLDWANDYIATALSSNPYGSLAWAGVGLLLPVSLFNAFRSCYPLNF